MSGLMFTHRPVEVAILRQGTQKADGTMAYDVTQVDTKAWVRDRTGMIRKPNGREVSYSRVFLMDEKEVIAVGDRIVLDDVNHEVLSVTLGRDVNGRLHHKKCLTGMSV